MEVDFRQTKHTGGSTNLLWDTYLNIPIARLIDCRAVCKYPTLNGDILLTSIPMDPVLTDARYSKKIYNVPSPNLLVGSAFSPNGKYALLVIWERSAVPPPNSYLLSEFVTDSVLILINWHTGASRELLRASNLNKGDMAAWHSTLWSADGKTIVVSREFETPLVVRLNHP